MDDKFTVSIWKCVTVFACVLVASIASCTANTHYQVTQALLKGVDPLQAACAHGSQETTTACDILAAKR